MSKAEAPARSPSDEELRRITRRAVAEIIPEDEFVRALRSGRRLRLKMGFDPTKPIITLGWAVGLRKLRQLQELGHTVVVIIGDWTARIGDPSGESRTRKMLPTREVRENANKILEQFFKILDRHLTEVRWQREWFDKFQLTKLARLASHVTVSKMLERDDFEKRYESGQPIHLQEFIYPLLQAYDSVAVEADVEFGGTDQKFNILLGRELQPKYKQKPQCAFLVPLLIGTDGKQKMSQSLGNYIAVDEDPHTMYGKIMEIPDSLVQDYFTLLTDVSERRLASIRHAIQYGGTQARDAKRSLARKIVEQFHSAAAAKAADREFAQVFRKGRKPKRTPALAIRFEKWALNHLKEAGALELEISDSRYTGRADAFLQLPDGTTVVVEVKARPVDQQTLSQVEHYRRSIRADASLLISLPKTLHILERDLTRSQLRRLLSEGAVEINGEKIEAQFTLVKHGDVIRVGKHRFLRIVDADKQG